MIPFRQCAGFALNRLAILDQVPPWAHASGLSSANRQHPLTVRRRFAGKAEGFTELLHGQRAGRNTGPLVSFMYLMGRASATDRLCVASSAKGEQVEPVSGRIFIGCRQHGPIKRVTVLFYGLSMLVVIDCGSWFFFLRTNNHRGWFVKLIKNEILKNRQISTKLS